MIFKRVDSNTINCIITPEDMFEGGIRLDDLFERKKEAMEFLRDIITEAAEKQKFELSMDYTSMKISVLPDHSISLTLSSDPARMPEAKLAETAVKDAVGGYAYRFASMSEVIRCCRSVKSDCVWFTSSLYYDKTPGWYYLIVGKKDSVGDNYEKQVLSMNEFGDLVASSVNRIAYIKEHTTCLLKEQAVEQLSSL